MINRLNTKKHPLRLYNTESRQKEILKPIHDHHVRMYTCGPTVYNYAHIGNFRTYVFEDLLRRTIKFFGMEITQVMNLTDVDDKTIRLAIAQNTTLEIATKPFTDAFFEDIKTLNIEPVEHYPAATAYIPQMITFIEKLLEKGIAYKSTDGCIYYAIDKFKRYGCLSHLKLDELQMGASERMAADEYAKENVADFVLWKHYDESRDGKIFWDSPFGPGRPGWHLECSVMAMSILGDTIDIHCGGIDNMFPHHENEIAQSESCSGKQFVNLWMHSEHLVVEGKKMSKSEGNFFTLRDLLKKGYSGKQVRFMLLQTHYKTQLNFTFSGLDGVKNTLQRLQDFVQRLHEVETTESLGVVNAILEKAHQSFAGGLADDLNISVALAAIFDMVREINGLCDTQKVSKSEAQKIIDLMKRFDTVLGVLAFDIQDEAIPVDLEEALEKRIQARKDKNWALSDTLRDLIIQRGYIIEDTATGSRLKKVII